jgi:hypothetical protein
MMAVAAHPRILRYAGKLSLPMTVSFPVDERIRERTDPPRQRRPADAVIVVAIDHRAFFGREGEIVEALIVSEPWMVVEFFDLGIFENRDAVLVLESNPMATKQWLMDTKLFPPQVGVSIPFGCRKYTASPIRWRFS